MGFDLTNLVQPIQGLEELSQPFSDDEIMKVLKELPPDRAPGPNGFNGLFVNRYWPIIEQENYLLRILMVLSLLSYPRCSLLRGQMIFSLFL